MTFALTSTAAAICLLLTVAFGWMGARASRPGRVRLAPWRFMMLLAFTALIAMAVHLVTLVRDDGGQESAPNAFISR